MVREGPDCLNDFLRISDALSAATDRLRETSESPRLDAELLLARALDVQRSYLFAHPEEEMDCGGFERFSSSVERRVNGMPMAYITGEKEFWSMTLIVTPATLVPRPETEVLVEQALMHIPRRAAMQVLDLGTGSGAVALAIARERPACEIVATDISEGALAVAKENARQTVTPNVEFVLGSWLEPVAGRNFDIIVSNPPYVAGSDPHLHKLQHEPQQALAAGSDGLDAIRQIARDAVGVMNPDGKILFEHGESQADAIAAILEAAGWSDIVNTKDLAGLPRVTTASRKQ
jgi:release factor glutamine methyltransferase